VKGDTTMACFGLLITTLDTPKENTDGQNVDSTSSECRLTMVGHGQTSRGENNMQRLIKRLAILTAATVEQIAHDVRVKLVLSADPRRARK
jgi:hypothetical protein